MSSERMSKNYPRIPNDPYAHFVWKVMRAHQIIEEACFPMHYSDNDRLMAAKAHTFASEEFAMEVRGKPTGLYLPKEYIWRIENEIYRADD